MMVTVIMAVQYAFLFGIDFLLASDSEMLSKMIGGNTMTYDIVLLGWIVLFLAGTVGIYFALWGICNLIQKKCHLKPMLAGVLKILFWIIILISAMFIRLYLTAAPGIIALNDSSYYDAAVLAVTEDANLNMMGVHGASFVYLGILSFVMRLLGTRPIAVILVQIVIQMLTILFVGAFMKRVFGYAAGMVTAILMAFLPLYTDKIFSATPGCFVALLFSFSIYLISVFRFMRNNVWRRIFAVILGIAIGYCIYLDVLSAGSLLVWLFAFIHELGDKERKKVVAPYLLVLLGVVIGVALSFAIDGAFMPEGFVIAAQSWWKVTYTSQLPEFSLVDSLLDNLCVPLCMGISGIAIFSLYDFFRRDRIEFELIWIMVMVFAATPMTKLGYLHDSTFSLIIYLIYAGVGFATIFKASSKKKTAVDAAVNQIIKMEEQEAAETTDESDEDVEAEELEYEVLDYEEADEEEPEEEEPEEEIDYSKITSVKDLPFWNEDDSRGPEDDDICDDPLDQEVADVIKSKKTTNEDNGEAESENITDSGETEEQKDLVIHMKEGYSIVLEGVEDFAEETYQEESEDDKPENIEPEEVQAEMPENKSKLKGSLVQVDDLPGMIPNPLPLPPKKAHSEINFNESVEEDDLFFDVDITDDDDFDV